jgi:tRNA(adenine34) deaminase
MPAVSDQDYHFMTMALAEAMLAAKLGETPVGAVVVQDDLVLGTGHNRVEIDKDPTAHAEILAIRRATEKSGESRLPEAVIYVTLEPCIMCAAAIVLARLKKVVFGAYDDRWGAFGSLFDFSHDPRLNHQVEVVPGVMRKESATLLKDFFVRLR